MRCSKCGKEIEKGDSYIIVKDNFLIIKYFEDKENIFCSEECLMETISAEYDINKEDGD